MMLVFLKFEKNHALHFPTNHNQSRNKHQSHDALKLEDARTLRNQLCICLKKRNFSLMIFFISLGGKEVFLREEMGENCMRKA